MSFTHLDLFSGIGGFALAVRWLGGETVGFCERDAWCRRVLAKHFPGVPHHDDVRTLTADLVRCWGRGAKDTTHLDHAAGAAGEAWRAQPGADEAQVVARRGGGEGIVDLITGGYPCQPFSLAGKRLGAADDRHLWPEMRRLIDGLRPRWVLAENVNGHVTMGLDVVLSELEADGYACGAVVIPAGAVHALHRRDRVWIMADAAARGLRRGTAPGEPGQPARGGEADTVPDTDIAGQQEHGGHKPVQPQHTTTEHARRHGTGTETPRALDAGADGLSAGLVRRPAAGPAWEPDMIRQAWADGSWEADLPRVVTDEADRRQKLMAAGNAIVPVLAYEILRVMLEDEG